MFRNGGMGEREMNASADFWVLAARWWLPVSQASMSDQLVLSPEAIDAGEKGIEP